MWSTGLTVVDWSNTQYRIQSSNKEESLEWIQDEGRAFLSVRLHKSQVRERIIETARVRITVLFDGVCFISLISSITRCISTYYAAVNVFAVFR